MRISRPFVLAVAACAFFGLAAFNSCGPRTVGYAVVLWGQSDGPVKTGEVVAVLKTGEQLADDTSCLLSVPSEKTPVEFPLGRVRIFAKRGEAEEYVKAFKPYLTTWAFSQKLDAPPLPIRKSAKTTADTVYKLRQGQVVKVIGRTEKKEVIKPFENYWYELVTDDGFSGWCYGHYLKIYTAEGDPSQTAAKLLSEDETLDRILGSTWRPDWFREMTNTSRVDLSKYREDIGLFPDPSMKVFKLVLPTYSMDFPYEEIRKLSAGNYEAVGGGLRIQVLDEERIQLSYRRNALETGGLFSVPEEDVAEVIAKEQERRQGLFDSLTARGARLSSTAYGSIKLASGMRFVWDGYDRLIPSIIAAGAGSTGRVDFNFHPAKGIQDAYDGVITFVFDSGGTAVSFLYSQAGGGIRLTSLAKDCFSDLDVTKAALSATVIFFSQSP